VPKAVKEALQINRELDNIKAQIVKHYQRLSDREAFVTAEMVRNSYHGFGREYETLLSAFDKDIANQKKRVGKDRAASTLWAMERSRKDVAEFIQSHYRRTDMSMLELTPEFIKDFAAYLSTDRGLANGTIWQRCTWLKGVVLRAHYNGKIPRRSAMPLRSSKNPFAQFHISPNCREREFLTEEELKAVVTHEFEDDNLAFVRDIFVFVCFTALSFINVKNQTTDNIVDINGDRWVVGCTLLWNLIAALQAEICAIIAISKEKNDLFLNLCSRIIVTSIVFIIFAHRTLNVGQE
jgi:hypothetical protein